MFTGFIGATGSTKLTANDKQILSRARFNIQSMGYLKDKAEDVTKVLYWDDGVFFNLHTLLDGAFNDSVSPGSAVSGTDGQGNFIQSNGSDPWWWCYNQKFENATGTDYYFGLRTFMSPKIAEIVPRTGALCYPYEEEGLGKDGHPDSVTWTGADAIKIVVDSVTESGVSHAGQWCKVWLSEASRCERFNEGYEPFDIVAIQWDGSNNYIEVDSLGQTTQETDTDKYWVAALGYRIVRTTSTDLRTEDGTLFIAEYPGNGPGALVIPGNFDYGDQNIISWTISGLSEITRTDTHGRLKINVRECPEGDTDEDQIRVEDKTAVKVFGVDEDGDVFIGGDLTFDGTAHYGGSTIIDWNSLFEITSTTVGSSGKLLFEGQNGSASDIIEFSGATYPIEFMLGGNIRFLGGSGGLAAIDAKNFTADPTELFFTDRWGSANLASANPDWGAGIGYYDGSIIGSFGESQAVDSALHGPGVLSGCEPSKLNPTQVQVTAGAVYGYWSDSGYATRQGHIQRPGTTTKTFSGGANTYILYYNFLLEDYEYSASINTILDDWRRTPIALVVWDGAQITTVTDIRFLAAAEDRKTIVTVGTAATSPRVHNFHSLNAAVEWANRVAAFVGTGSYPGKLGCIEIHVVSDVTVTTSPITITAEGLRIVGQGQAKILWNTTNNLFSLEADRVSIERTNISFIGGVNTAYLIQVPSTDTSNVGFRFKDNRVTHTTNPIRGVIDRVGPSAATSEWIISGNYVYISAKTAAATDHIFNFEGTLTRSHIIDNILWGDSGGTATRVLLRLGNGGLRDVIRGNHFRYGAFGILAPTTVTLTNIGGNTFQDHRSNAISISNANSNVIVSENFVETAGIDGVSNAIYVAGNYSRITDNYIRPVTTASQWAIVTDGSYVLIDGNVCEDTGNGINAQGNFSIVSGNFVSTEYADAIRLTGTDSIAEHNSINKWMSPGGTFSAIAVTGARCAVRNNNLTSTPAQTGDIGINFAATATYFIASGNLINIEVSTATIGAIGIRAYGPDGTINGNNMPIIGGTGNGGLGIVLEATADRTAVSGNSFGRVYGHYVHIKDGVVGFTITGSMASNVGYSGITNPYLGVQALDGIWCGGEWGSITGNVADTLSGGGTGYHIHFTSTSNDIMVQLNVRRTGGGANIQIDGGATNIEDGASLTNNNYG